MGVSSANDDGLNEFVGGIRDTIFIIMIPFWVCGGSVMKCNSTHISTNHT